MERNEHIYEGTKTKAEYIKELSDDDTSTRNIARIVLITGVVGVLLTFGGKIMPQIIPIKDLKKTSEISELCHRAAEPIYITKNGYGDMVI